MNGPRTEPERASWERAELIGALQKIGLSDREAALYLAALRHRGGTAPELAREAGVDRVAGYRLLEAMRAQGLVEVTLERPRRFVATRPGLLFERVLRRRRESLARDEAEVRALLGAFERFAVVDGAAPPRYQVVTGTALVEEHLREAFDRAKEEVAVLSTARGLRESLRADIHLGVGPLLERGGKFRLIAESDPRIHSLLGRFALLRERYPRAEIRLLAPQTARVTIVDRTEAILFLVPDPRLGTLEQVAVWTNHTDFVSGQAQWFEALWERAGPHLVRAPGTPAREMADPWAETPSRRRGAASATGTASDHLGPRS